MIFYENTPFVLLSCACSLSFLPLSAVRRKICYYIWKEREREKNISNFNETDSLLLYTTIYELIHISHNHKIINFEY